MYPFNKHDKLFIQYLLQLFLLPSFSYYQKTPLNHISLSKCENLHMSYTWKHKQYPQNTHWLIDCCLTPTLAVFQLHCGVKIYKIK